MVNFTSQKNPMFKQHTILIGMNLSSPGVQRCSLLQISLQLILTLHVSWPFINTIPGSVINSEVVQQSKVGSKASKAKSVRVTK